MDLMTENTMTLAVDFLAGTSIESAIEQSVLLHRILPLVYVYFYFNGISISVSRHAELVENIRERYLTKSEQGDKYWIL